MKSQLDLSAHPMDAGPLPADTIKKASKLFLVNGALSLQNVFPRSLVQSLQDEFRTHYETRPRDEIVKHCNEVGGNRYMFTVKLQQPFNNPALYASNRLLPIVRDVLGSDCVIQSFGAVCAFPGAEMQHFHRDHPPLYPEASGVDAFLPPYALHVVIPMIDLDAECGTTAMWEGSHRARTNQQIPWPNDSEADYLHGASLLYPKMGDCYLMDFRLRHRGTANRSDKARTILYIVYSRGWFQDHYNFDKQVRLDIEQSEFEQVPEQYRYLFRNARPSY